MGADVVLLALLVLDLVAVAFALWRLQRRRAIGDITDQRYRDHPDRASSVFRR